ncbi:hypothetical protein Lal_00015320 [Lupinus albus]|nr:hypothetical protein Lal_00015320 [Lupinus albus]
MRISREEIFGPVAAVIRVKDYEEALAVANDTPFGLSAGIATTSLKHATHFKRNSEAGMVMVNLPTAGVDFHVPFGGRKGSSFGPREQGKYAAEFFTVLLASVSAGKLAFPEAEAATIWRPVEHILVNQVYEGCVVDGLRRAIGRLEFVGVDEVGSHPDEIAFIGIQLIDPETRPDLSGRPIGKLQPLDIGQLVRALASRGYGGTRFRDADRRPIGGEDSGVDARQSVDDVVSVRQLERVIASGRDEGWTIQSLCTRDVSAVQCQLIVGVGIHDLRLVVGVTQTDRMADFVERSRVEVGPLTQQSSLIRGPAFRARLTQGLAGAIDGIPSQPYLGRGTISHFNKLDIGNRFPCLEGIADQLLVVRVSNGICKIIPAPAFRREAPCYLPARASLREAASKPGIQAFLKPIACGVCGRCRHRSAGRTLSDYGALLTFD